MQLSNTIVITLILVGFLVGFGISAEAAPEEKGAGGPAVVQGQRELSDGPPPIQEQRIVLSPFFRFQRKDSKVWVERIIVAFTMALPQDSPKHDLNHPTFRKIIYELLQSGEPENNIQAQALAGLDRHLGINVDAAVQISRSVIIVR